MADSSISKFFEKSLKDRLDVVADFSGLSQDELKIIEDATGGISYDDADGMIENAIGTFSLPLGIATNFRINDKDYLIPMVIEETSVIAEPTIEDNKVLLSEFPNVCPKPRSNGSRTIRYSFVDNSTESTSFGFRKSLALPCIFNSYLEYNSTIKCSEISADKSSREGTFLNIPFNELLSTSTQSANPLCPEISTAS